MMASELTPKAVRLYLKIDCPGAKEEREVEKELSIILSAALDYCRSFTGMTGEEMDKRHDITIAILVMCSDMYDNRQMTIPAGGISNDTVLGILDMYRRNLL